MIDDIDKKLLRAVQVNCREPLERLSTDAGLSVAATQKRIKKLKADKVILKEVAILSPLAVNRGMTFIVNVGMERDSPADFTVFRKKIEEEPLVQQSYCVTGQADFILIIRAADMEEFEQMTQRIFFEVSNVRRFTTSVAMASCPIETAIKV